MNKKKILVIVGVIFILLTIGVSAATIMYTANNVSYSSSTLSGNNVQSALENLYNKYQSSSTTPPSGMTCTRKTNIKCRRATTLHTEPCTSTDTNYKCQNAGYALNATITYGNQTTIEGVLTTGDAFDCDVNGDGTFNPSTERFYYVSDYYDTSTKNFNDKVAVLIYYSNVIGGEASSTGAAYALQADCQAVGTCTSSTGCNWYGPVTERSELPKTSQWTNIRLYKDTRQILAENNATSTSGGALPTIFSYSGYAARLLTFQEAYNGCNSFVKVPDSTGAGALDAKCLFLLEGTQFSTEGAFTYGIWLESPSQLYSDIAYTVDGFTRNLVNTHTNFKSYGARPTIEILKSQILY
ncbi:MAG: hypothetical protein IKE70_01620 [Bacilli bacterium]|nr:hypothetical protein [Bacilli bacterium]